MKYFVATVLQKGKKEQLKFYAKDKKEASEIVKRKNSGIIIKVTQEEEPLELWFKRLKQDILSRRKPKPDALIASIRELAIMSNAGISIYESLKGIADSTTDDGIRSIFSKLAQDINAGSSLTKSMENFRSKIGSITIAMVELGEKTGRLDDALYSLADMLEEIHSNTIKFKKAMAYPINVMFSMAVAFVILISFVVPKFKNIFEKFNTDLPLPTKILLKLEYIFEHYGLILLLALLLFTSIISYLINKNRKFRYHWHKVLLKTYLIKNIIIFSTLNRFTLILSELIRSGIPITEALESSVAMVETLPLQERLSFIRSEVERGSSLSDGLKKSQLFENMVIQMVSAGEESGKVDLMFSKVAIYYKMRFDSIIDTIGRSIEPILLLIIGSMVMLLALGIFLPMWDMGNALQGRR